MISAAQKPISARQFVAYPEFSPDFPLCSRIETLISQICASGLYPVPGEVHGIIQIPAREILELW
jgi:hypothetical protein